MKCNSCQQTEATVIFTRVAGDEKHTLHLCQTCAAKEADQVREQMLDIIRVVPASIIAAANAALPVPGTSVVTPCQEVGVSSASQVAWPS